MPTLLALLLRGLFIPRSPTDYLPKAFVIQIHFSGLSEGLVFAAVGGAAVQRGNRAQK